MKRHNRQAEQLLLNAEKMSELAVFFDYRDYYPGARYQRGLEAGAAQPGARSGGGLGHRPHLCRRGVQYQEIFERGNRALNFSLENLGLQLDTRGEGVPLVVYNPQSWDRTDLVTAEVSAFSLPARMVAVHGTRDVPVQILKAPAKAGRRETATVAFVAQNVPQMGLKLYRLVAGTGNRQSRHRPCRWDRNRGPIWKTSSSALRSILKPATSRGSMTRRISAKRFTGEGNSLTAWEDTAEQARKALQRIRGAGLGHRLDRQEMGYR